MPAGWFSQLRFSDPSCYILGLNGTPDRKDGLEDVIWDVCGPLAHSVKQSQRPDVTVSFLQTGVRGGIGELCEDSDRTKMLHDEVERLVSSRTRRALVLSNRREHCKTLVQSLRSSNINAELMMHGNSPSNEKLEAATCVVAAMGTGREGLDIGGLNTLILATPVSDVRQAVGRVLRPSSAQPHWWIPVHGSKMQ